MTSEEKVMKVHKTATIGVVVGTNIYRVYKTDRCRSNQRLSEVDGDRELAWERAWERVVEKCR